MGQTALVHHRHSSTNLQMKWNKTKKTIIIIIAYGCHSPMNLRRILLVRYHSFIHSLSHYLIIHCHWTCQFHNWKIYFSIFFFVVSPSSSPCLSGLFQEPNRKKWKNLVQWMMMKQKKKTKQKIQRSTIIHSMLNNNNNNNIYWVWTLFHVGGIPMFMVMMIMVMIMISARMAWFPEFSKKKNYIINFDDDDDDE